MKISNETLIEQVTTDPDGFIEAGQEIDCEEAVYTLQGKETDLNGAAE